MSSKQAVEKALSLVGQGYIYGAKGQKCSPAFRQKQAEQYPDQAEYILGVGAKWDGVPVWDCAQLTRAAAKAGGFTLPSGATSQWNKADWAKKGTIDTLPPGEAVFLYRRKGGSTTTMQFFSASTENSAALLMDWKMRQGTQMFRMRLVNLEENSLFTMPDQRRQAPMAFISSSSAAKVIATMRYTSFGAM